MKIIDSTYLYFIFSFFLLFLKISVILETKKHETCNRHSKIDEQNMEMSKKIIQTFSNDTFNTFGSSKTIFSINFGIS